MKKIFVKMSLFVAMGGALSTMSVVSSCSDDKVTYIKQGETGGGEIAIFADGKPVLSSITIDGNGITLTTKEEVSWEVEKGSDIVRLEKAEPTKSAILSNAVKVVSLNNGTATVTATSSEGRVVRITITVNMEATPTLPGGALPGAFSVSPAKKIYFSQGNLQADLTNNNDTAFMFAAHQWDIRGTKNLIAEEGQSTRWGDTIDLFGWSGKDGHPWGISLSTTDDEYSGEFKDWGEAINEDSSVNCWRTLTKDEWLYLVDKDENGNLIAGGSVRSNKYMADVTVCGVNYCLVLYPDNWNGDMSKTEYNSEEWAEAEAKGAVCLPAPGYRTGVSYGSNFREYWSSTNDQSKKAYYFKTNKCASYGRKMGYPVRLVCDLDAE